MKPSFILHTDSLQVLNKLSNEQKGILFDAIYRYHLGEMVELDPLLDIVFLNFKCQFERDLVKYEKAAARSRQNGTLGGRPKSTENQSNINNPEEPTITQNNPVGLLITHNNPEEPRKPDSDSDSVSVNVSDNDSVSDLKKKVIKKTQSIDFRKNEFLLTLKSFLEKYGKEILNEFFAYWTEPNQAKTKMRFEMEKTWDMERRLMVWQKRSEKFTPDAKDPKTTFNDYSAYKPGLVSYDDIQKALKNSAK